ncbi:hypothetical protein R3P38DRAFT_2543512 [Favolaschia claudopus]|uniref:DEAD/DEAH-box helicase domain-containing protein n=1 Tax=Favolaschia claudopus TaxID=2862362 RepID=A0AAW0AT35_9AGAR
MDPNELSIYLELQQTLHDIRHKPLDDLFALALDIMPCDDLFLDFINSLDEKHKTLALKASLLVYFASKCKIVPRIFQLEANNALEDGRDVLIDSGTGSGKTLCQIIPNLMHPTTMSISISPLKRLQILQVAELQSWGINAISINEDTPNIKQLWNHIRDGYFQHLIVRPGLSRGHW